MHIKFNLIYSDESLNGHLRNIYLPQSGINNDPMFVLPLVIIKRCS